MPQRQNVGCDKRHRGIIIGHGHRWCRRATWSRPLWQRARSPAPCPSGLRWCDALTDSCGGSDPLFVLANRSSAHRNRSPVVPGHCHAPAREDGSKLMARCLWRTPQGGMVPRAALARYGAAL
jgi:hypothetical protein